MLAFAHRGGAYHPDIEGLENTMAAFRHAVDLGYDYLETDVHVTRDGVLLAFHDQVLDRVSDRRGAIVELTHAEVAEALIGGQERVPTMAELLDAFPECRFNIDLKSDGAVAAAGRAGRRARPVGPGPGRQLLAAPPQRLPRPDPRPGRHLRAPAARCWRSVLLPSGALADRLTRRRVAALQVPAPSRAVDGGHPRASYDARTRPASTVHVWTIDDPAEMHELLDRGVDGLITDRTDILRDVLTERGQWREES